MTASELIQVLSRFSEDAVVVIGAPQDGGVGRLRSEEVREVRLRFCESNGLGWYEVAEEDGPCDTYGVLIG
ncbi:MAG: hypothetical protein V4540_03465 [Pseudomonadota bacterium]